MHEDPDRALSDGPNSYPLAELPALLAELQRIDAVAKAARRSANGARAAVTADRRRDSDAR